jgi:UDP-2,3-diacylglucosamine pyrophosphatase LpxH
MNTFVFSDCHLTQKFDKQKFLFLQKMISQADRVIINGDFWDGYLITFSQFIESDWKKLFPLLKAKHAIYIYGNHDKASLCDERANLFSDLQTTRYVLDLQDKRMVFEHGNKYSPALDDRLKLKRPPRFIKPLIRFHYKRINSSLQKQGLLAFADSYQRVNKKMKEKVLRTLKPDEIMVCGHSHYAEYDPSNQFINTGFIDHGFAQYLSITGSKATLMDVRYSI